MKKYFQSIILASLLLTPLISQTGNSVKVDSTEIGVPYAMKTAKITQGQLIFNTESDFDEALKVGFFRVERPTDINIKTARNFNHNFVKDPKYTNFGSNGPVNGFIESEFAQVVRFTLERDYWDKKGWGTALEIQNPNYSSDLQKFGNQMKDIGTAVLNAILDKFQVPQEMKFKATAGASAGEGSYFLNFNYYDPTKSDKSVGLGAHTDWGHITVLDTIDSGLQAEVDGKWRPLELEEGYFIINFGEPLAKLLPKVNACNHRVVKQVNNPSKSPRTSIVMFVDPRVGTFRPEANVEGEGQVWDWDPEKKQLINGEKTAEYFARLSKELYGETK